MQARAIKLIVGLGNPGARYADTRHNVGFWLLDAVAACAGGRFRRNGRLAGDLAEVDIAGQRLRLLKPETFVNASGRSVGMAARYFGIEVDEILIVHDELDLDAGSARLKFGGGHGGHNGLRDIIPHLGSKDFARLRLGIGHPGHKDAVTPWVLSRPARDEAEAIVAAISRVLDLLPELVGGQMEAATRILHTDDRARPGKQQSESREPDEDQG